MDKRSLVMYLSGLAATGALIGIVASCSDQPRIKCTAGHGAFSLKYTVVSGAEGCTAAGIEVPKGGTMGVEAYNYALADNSNLDPNRGSLGMQPTEIDDEIGARGEDKNAAHKPYALGDWGTSEPGADNFCNIPSMNPIEQNLGEVPAVPPSDAGPGSPAEPAINLKYEWSGVRFYNMPSAPGNQLVADLTYTKSVADGGTCTAKLHVTGLWPSVSCYDADAKKLDPTLCNADSDIAKGRPTGSGISPDINWTCDPDLQLCVLAKDPPSFR